MKKKYLPVITSALVALLFLFATMSATASAPHIPAACSWMNVSEGESTIIQSWTITETAPCVGLTFQKAGQFVISSGWVFTAPLTANGQPVDVIYVEGELAPQIGPGP